MVEVSFLSEINQVERKNFLRGCTLLFPSGQRMRFRKSQIRNLMDFYKGRVYSLGSLDNPAHIGQLVVSSIDPTNSQIQSGKIVLGNLRNWHLFNSSLSETINTLIASQLSDFERIFIEVSEKDGNGKMYETLKHIGFKEVVGIGEIQGTLSKFLMPGSPNLNISPQKDGTYKRKGGSQGEITLIKRLLTISR